MWWEAILHHYHDDVDLLCRCNVLVSLFSMSGFPIFKEHMFQGILSVVACKCSIFDMENNT